MSIYFSPSKPIPACDLLDGRLGRYDLTVHQSPDDPTRYVVTDGVNSMCLGANSDDGSSITDMTWYCCMKNEAGFILEALQESFDVVIYSEYEPEYWGGTCPWDMLEDDLVESGGSALSEELNN
jgi:hypothetical protein